MHLKLSPTEKLLLFCARSTLRTFNKSEKSEIQHLLAQRINWQDFITRAKYLGIAPQCYLHLKPFHNAVPPPIQKKLEAIFTRNAAQNMKLWALLKDILRAFEGANIDVIPLKGPLLSEHLHGNIGLRSASDIDLLIKSEDYEGARDVLKEKGYIPLKLTDYSEKFSSTFRRHEQFASPDPSKHLPMVELHWSFYIASPRPYDMRPVWQSAVPEKIANIRFLTLPPTFTLIHLAVNLRLHGYINLKQLSDLDALLAREKENISWREAINHSLQNGQKTALYYALFLAARLLGTDVPPYVLKALRPPRLQHMFVCGLVKPSKILAAGDKTVARVYWDAVRLLTSDSLRDALTTIKSTALYHPQDLMARYQISQKSRQKSLSTPALSQPGKTRPFYLIFTATKNLLKYLSKK
ncbi:MAG: nucleotidyltransferase family protein [Candidatus Aminicenantales bacterium]